MHRKLGARLLDADLRPEVHLEMKRRLDRGRIVARADDAANADFDLEEVVKGDLVRHAELLRVAQDVVAGATTKLTRRPGT
jgi:hypothetical protein